MSYTYAANVWALSLVQGPVSRRPVPTPMPRQRRSALLPGQWCGQPPEWLLNDEQIHLGTDVRHSQLSSPSSVQWHVRVPPGAPLTCAATSPRLAMSALAPKPCARVAASLSAAASLRCRSSSSVAAQPTVAWLRCSMWPADASTSRVRRSSTSTASRRSPAASSCVLGGQMVPLPVLPYQFSLQSNLVWGL